MIKRVVAFIFIFLANIIILAHAAIPHHHFPFPTASVEQSAEYQKEHKHEHEHNHVTPDFNHHHHNDKDDYNHCSLNKVVSINKSNFKSTVGSDIDSDFGNIFFDFHFILTNNRVDWDIPIITINRQPRLFSSSYISYVASVSGLRAPPAV